MIGTASYKVISDTLGEAQRLGIDALSPFQCMMDNLQRMDISTSERYRKVFFNSLMATYSLIFNKHATLNNPMINAVRSLNDHVLRLYGEQYGYTTIDEFLEDQYLEADPTFASMSRFLGYDVTIEGTKAARWQDIDDNWEDVDQVVWEQLGWSNF
jgi:hypothetical protein